VGVGDIEAGTPACGTLDVRKGATDATDEVMVVVACVDLVAGRLTGRLEAAHQPVGREHSQDVVDRLGRDRTESLPSDSAEGVYVTVGKGGQLGEDRHSRCGHTEASRSEQLARVSRMPVDLDCRIAIHDAPIVAPFLE